MSSEKRSWIRSAFGAGFWLPFVSAVLLFAAFPPLDQGYLAWFALAPLIWSLLQGGFWRGFRRACWFGTLFFLGNLWWLERFLEARSGSVPLAVLPWVLLSVIQGLYIGLFGAVIGSAARRSESLGLLIVPPAWVAVEWLRSVWPAGGFAWAQLSYSQWHSPFLLAPVALGGTHFLGAMMVSVSAVTCFAFRRPERTVPTYAALAVLVALLLVSQLAFVGLYDEDRTVRVAAAQPAFDLVRRQAFEIAPEFELWKRDTLEKAAIAGAELVVFPEGYQESPPYFEDPPPTGYIISGHRGFEGKVYQTAYGVSPAAPLTMFDKTRLVVFGEYVPWRDRLPFLEAFQIPGGDVSPAPLGEPLEVRGLRIAVGICFESLFSEVIRAQVRRGADMIAILTIDDWYPEYGMRQHAAASVVRAVECRRTLVRSASSGITFIVNPRGVVVARLPIGVRDYVVADVPLVARDKKPPWLQDALPYLSVATVLTLLCWRTQLPWKRKKTNN